MEQPVIGSGTSEGWWDVRERRLRSAVQKLREKDLLTVIQPFSAMDNDIPGMNVLFAGEGYLLDDEGATVDIYFNQGYHPDIKKIWDVTRTGRAAVTSCWFWDNHHLFVDTMHAAMLADVSFCAHSYSTHYVPNELGRYGGFVPLTPIFWSNSLVRSLMLEATGKRRRDELYGGYNSYAAWPERDAFLNACMEAIPNNVIKIWPHGLPSDQHLYYTMPREDKFREWLDYKVTLCVSFGINTTMRMFESLLSGQIPVVVGEIHDLDAIIPLSVQEQLPLIRVKTFDAAAVREAYAVALERFDLEGEEGVQRRSRYILENHMPRNRIIQMVDYIRNLDI
jgi:hypothetical protein